VCAAAVVCLAQSASVTVVVRSALAAGDAGAAQKVLAQYKAARGTTPDYIEALSWLGRAEFQSKAYAAAEQNAQEVRTLCLAQLTRRKLDAEPSLPAALGASIEVQAQTAVAEGRRDEAVTFLKAEAIRWKATSIASRIHKNLNLLTLEGKPAPPLEGTSLSKYKGHPTLLFFWAHWCSDCKAEIAIIAQLQRAYGSRGLMVIAPTQHYGYVAGGDDAPREVETKYIKEIYAQYYSALGSVETPVSEANFLSYGVSTTPTLALLDKQGIVRLYNPGNLTYDALASRIKPLL
jgi:thiol-disulfide isomerase/thioredoxin